MPSPMMNSPSGLLPPSMSSSVSSIKCICCWNWAISRRCMTSPEPLKRSSPPGMRWVAPVPLVTSTNLSPTMVLLSPPLHLEIGTIADLFQLRDQLGPINQKCPPSLIPAEAAYQVDGAAPAQTEQALADGTVQ